MARIEKYQNDDDFSLEDKVVGSSYIGTINGIKKYKTRNFSLETIQSRIGDKSLEYALRSLDWNVNPEVPNSWKITHNLNKKPAVVIIDSAGNTINGDIVYTDNNVLYIVTSSGFGGTAYLN
jgi:hypothetical protein